MVVVCFAWAQARVKEAKDELRRLKGEQVAAQCAAAQELLAQHTAPRKVVLNLAAGGGSDRPLLMPAVLVGEMEPPPELASGAARGVVTATQGQREPPPGPFYACLSADNRLMRASVVCLAGVLEGEAGAVTEEDAERVRAALEAVRSNGWSNVEGEGRVRAWRPGNWGPVKWRRVLGERRDRDSEARWQTRHE